MRGGRGEWGSARILAEWLGDQRLRPRIQRARSISRRKRDVVRAALGRYCSDFATYETPGGGIFFWLELAVRLDVDAVRRRALARGVACRPGERFATDPGRQRPPARLVPPGVRSLVWGAAWALHWFRLLRAFGARGDLHLATGSATGLVALGVGSGGLLGELLRRGYVELTDLTGAEPTLREWAIVAALGAVVWAWYWWREYRSAPQSDAWYVHVLLVGALGGMAATIVATATGLYDVLVWAIGDRAEAPADEHFQWLPVSVGVLAVGAASWAYHRWVIGRDGPDVRTGPMRVYDYLVAGAGLVSSIVALSVGIVAVIEGITPEPRGVDVSVTNRLLLAATIGIVGAPTWAVAWNRVRDHRARDPRGELYSDVRRVYLIGLFGVGGLVVLGSAVAVLVIGLQDLLDGEFGGETVRAMRIGLALIASVAGIAWYHLAVFRADRAASQDLEPEPEVVRHRVIVVAMAGSPTPANLARNTRAEVTAWTRLDSVVEADVDPAQLASEVDACPSPDVLVIGTTAGWSVIPIAGLSRVR